MKHEEFYFLTTWSTASKCIKNVLSCWIFRDQFMKDVRIQSFSSPYLLAFALNTKIYSVRMCLNTDQKISVNGRFFIQWWTSLLLKKCMVSALHVTTIQLLEISVTMQNYLLVYLIKRWSNTSNICDEVFLWKYLIAHSH